MEGGDLGRLEAASAVGYNREGGEFLGDKKPLGLQLSGISGRGGHGGLEAVAA